MRVIFAVVTILLAAAPAIAESPRASMKMPASGVQATLDDIKATLGSVPSFFKSFPEASLPGAWAVMKNVQLSDKTAIPPKYKDLIGLAVGAQIPCHYCTFFHSEAAKLGGATDRELQEAVALAATEREWSTFINGTQGSEEQFRRETDQIMTNIREKMAAKAPASPEMKVTFNSPQEALTDIQETLGLVPSFVKEFPQAGVPGAWAEQKTLVINPDTAIPSKYKDLISLSVAAQVPCSRCIYWNTEAAKVDGATQEEINEAVAMASISRHWSSVLNGMQTNDVQFRREMTEVFSTLRKRSAKPAA